ncbi:hypothetical protein EP331_00015 [bacterium]|nr:MAG: hypothetical protein EP331_00015 [bacterium]
MSNLSISEMSLRDYFAAQAIQGILSNQLETKKLSELGLTNNDENELLSKYSYKIADAMIAEKTRTEQLNTEK